MEILDQFGFDFALFFAQVINFLILAFLFKRFAYKPILKVIKTRNEAIKKGLSDAQKAGEALEKAESQKDEILKKASHEAQQILSQTKIESEKMRQELMEKTKEDIEKMTNQAKEQLLLEKESFVNGLKDVSLEMAQEILEKTITNMFDKKEQDALIEKGLKKIKNEQTKN